MSFRGFSFTRVPALALLAASLCFGQAAWQTVVDLPGVDWQGLSGARKQAALHAMRAEDCGCGCSMKVAECRIKDPSCAVSQKLASTAVRESAEGKTLAEIRADLKRMATEPPPLLEEPVKLSIAGAPVKGAENARVTIVEFSDFQCPYCAKAVGQAKALLSRYPKDVRLVFKQFPLDQHTDAELAGEASLAAAAQGKFWQMHDKMYADFRDLSRGKLIEFARQIGLDVPRFTKELDSHKYTAAVSKERDEGEAAGVNSTPTFFINGKRYNGAFVADELAPLIEKELK